MVRGGGRLLGNRNAGARSCVAGALIAITVVAAGFSVAHGAAWIGIYTAQTHMDKEWCITLTPFTPKTIYVYYVSTGDFPQATGAEYKIDGMPGVFGSDYVGSLINAPGSNVNLGSGFDGTGHNVAWPVVQPFDANGGLLLASYSLLVFNPDLPIDGVHLTITQRTPPNNLAFPCPLITDAGFLLYCTGGLSAAINDPGFCVDAVESKSWSEIRSLYR
jgi:hypothetical protein